MLWLLALIQKLRGPSFTQGTVVVLTFPFALPLTAVVASATGAVSGDVLGKAVVFSQQTGSFTGGVSTLRAQIAFAVKNGRVQRLLRSDRVQYYLSRSAEPESRHQFLEQCFRHQLVEFQHGHGLLKEKRVDPHTLEDNIPS